ncbi:MAG: glycine zipper 2TM domain-containing protein [Granulosicoccus sp.]
MKYRKTSSNLVIAGSIATCFALTMPSALAAKNGNTTQRFTEYANVVNVQPVYRQVTLREPTQQCWTEQEQHLIGYEQTSRYREQRVNRSSTGSAIVGGLIGGVIGNQLGRGHSRGSRTGATVAGAIIGSAIGNETGGQNSRHRRFQESGHTQSTPIYEMRDVERCKRVVESRTERQLQHYNVTYRYKGRNFVTQMPRDPGSKIELQVSVVPARR